MGCCIVLGIDIEMELGECDHRYSSVVVVATRAGLVEVRSIFVAECRCFLDRNTCGHGCCKKMLDLIGFELWGRLALWEKR